MVWDSGAADAAAGDVAMGVAWSDNAYSAPDFSVHGSFTHSACPGTTACRAPGVMQSIPLHEMAMEVAAEVAGLPPDLVREANMYKLGDQALGGVVIGARGYDWRLPEMWASAKAAWDVGTRRSAVAEFNTRNRWRKRGLALIPTKYGIGVSATDYHEGCTLGVMPDGSVLIRHGGCEVGQGIHTKAAQVRPPRRGEDRGGKGEGCLSREGVCVCVCRAQCRLPPLTHLRAPLPRCHMHTVPPHPHQLTHARSPPPHHHNPRT